MTAELVPAEVLAYHGLKPDDRMAGLMVLLAARYELDPLAGHLEVIKTRSGPKLYITRDGYLIFGHRSGVLDGIVVEDLHHGDSGWSATVSVWRKDMRFPFRYSAGCGDQEPQAVQGDGDAMALARAERRALKRAFPVIAAIEIEHGLGGADIERDHATPISVEPPPGPSSPSGSVPWSPAATVGQEWEPTNADQAEAHRVLANMPVEKRIAFLSRWRIDDFGSRWPAEAVAEVLAGPAGGSAAGAPAGPAGDAGG